MHDLELFCRSFFRVLLNVQQSLREMGICFDEIVFGKPVADVYVSGRAGNIHGDIEKEASTSVHSR